MIERVFVAFYDGVLSKGAKRGMVRHEILTAHETDNRRC